jgi:diguanylate cyclase (GGDEF)-like protein/PAS domain S-box-containing protein
MEEIRQRLKMAMAAAGIVVWDSTVVEGSVERGTVHWSAEGALLLGLPGVPVDQGFPDFLRFVHPDDRAALLRTIQHCVDRRLDYDLAYRIVTASGRLRWLHAKASVVLDADDKVRGTLGLLWDVTAAQEAALRTERERDLAQVTLDAIGDAVLTTDRTGRVQFMNRVAEHLTGWPLRHADGRDIGQVLQIVDELDGAPQPNPVHRCLQTGETVSVSAHSELLALDGRRVAVEDTVAPIWSRGGELLGSVTVMRDVSHERQLKRQLSWHASHDPLTGLVNRREFEHLVAQAVATARADGHQHALLYLDLDRFKLVNDTCGHGAGDVLLQLLARMLQTQLREADVLARLGGDELGVLLMYCPLPRARAIAEDMRQAVKEFRFSWDGRTFDIGASSGLAPIEAGSKAMTELLIAADQACYLAKEQGRNRVQVYHESHAILGQRHGEMLWITRLNEAFERRMFRLFAQPIVPLQGDGPGHAEVLVRLAATADAGAGPGDGQLILPGAFIPAAERYDMMPAIDRWVVEHVCAHLQEEPGELSVNLSGVSLNDEHMLGFITEQFSRYGIDPAAICFEITETAIIANLVKAQEFMAGLRRLGCRFSLDDFGSGLSSFAYLKSLPVDYLKIDGVFIRDIANNHINRAMVAAINEVGHVMGICTVAEYVEDGATLEQVRALGLDFAQGYAVGALRPLARTPGAPAPDTAAPDLPVPDPPVPDVPVPDVPVPDLPVPDPAPPEGAPPAAAPPDAPA